MLMQRFVIFKKEVILYTTYINSINDIGNIIVTYGNGRHARS